MKLTPQRVPAFLRAPGDCRVVLLYGDDAGMISERAGGLVRSVAGSLDDPFRVVELGRDEAGRIVEEAASLPFTGGRRVVRVREAGEALSRPVGTILESASPGFVVLEAPGLPSRSRLRTLVEGAPDGVAIGCYPQEGRALEETIRATLGGVDVGVSDEALGWLAGQLGSDRGTTRQELEKLALYAGPGGRVDLDAATVCVGDLAGLSLDDALFAATTGDVATADRALELAVAQGAAPVSIVRAAQGHLQRLHRARLVVDEGQAADEVVRSLRPPLFFRRVGSFTKALSLWSSAALLAGIAGLTEAEKACKRTAAPDQTLARSAILTLARRALANTGRRTTK